MTTRRVQSFQVWDLFFNILKLNRVAFVGTPLEQVLFWLERASTKLRGVSVAVPALTVFKIPGCGILNKGSGPPVD